MGQPLAGGWGAAMLASSCILPGAGVGWKPGLPQRWGRDTSALLFLFSLSPVPRPRLPSGWENHPALPSDGELTKRHLTSTEGEPGVFNPEFWVKMGRTHEPVPLKAGAGDAAFSGPRHRALM